ncbi:MAG: hypothetical protein EOO28_09745 [Comamonadaceae bacterium]|nr:MAG: hypothetical protein EOO28_09745 [Comamonadaceae bacterium]
MEPFISGLDERGCCTGSRVRIGVMTTPSGTQAVPGVDMRDGIGLAVKQFSGATPTMRARVWCAFVFCIPQTRTIFALLWQCITLVMVYSRQRLRLGCIRAISQPPRRPLIDFHVLNVRQRQLFACRQKKRPTRQRCLSAVPCRCLPGPPGPEGWWHLQAFQ